jgi:hypothetical protein
MRRLLRCCLPVLGIIAQVTAADDIIQLHNGQRLFGIIDPSASDDEVTAIKTDRGVMRIPKELIDTVDESYETRRKRVSDTDYRGLLALAQYCLQKNDTVHAREVLEIAIKLIDADAECWRLLAELIDVPSDAKGPEKALPYYQSYRKKGGTDKATLARLKQLEDIKNDYDSGKTTTQPESKTPVANEGLEARGWENESQQWSNPLESKIITVDDKGKSNRVLQLTYSAGDKDKAAIKKSVRFSIDENCVLTVFVSNPTDQPIKLALGIKTGNHVFHESPALPVPPGTEWHTLRYNLRGKNFKSESTKWDPSGTVDNLKDVKELQFLIYNKDRGGTLLLDGIDFGAPKEL